MFQRNNCKAELALSSAFRDLSCKHETELFSAEGSHFAVSFSSPSVLSSLTRYIREPKTTSTSAPRLPMKSFISPHRPKLSTLRILTTLPSTTSGLVTSCQVVSSNVEGRDQAVRTGLQLTPTVGTSAPRKTRRYISCSAAAAFGLKA